MTHTSTPPPIPMFHKTNRNDPPNAPPDAANDKTRSRSGLDCYSWFLTHARNNNLLDVSFTDGTRMRTKSQTAHTAARSTQEQLQRATGRPLVNTWSQ